MKIWIFLLIGLLSFHLIVNSSWIIANNAPILWDPANHTHIAIRISENIKNFNLLGLLKTSNYYPIFVHTLTGFFLAFSGPIIKFAQFFGTVYFLITLVIIFIYIRKITDSLKIAFFTTALFSFHPVIFDQSRNLMLDIPSVGIFFLSLYFLEKSDSLTNRKFSILTFASVGLLAMTKWTNIFYLAIPGIFALINVIKYPRKRIIFRNILLGVVSFAFVALPWYLINFSDILYLTNLYGEGDPKAHPQVLLSLENILTYYRIYLYTQATPIIALTFFASLPIFAFLRNQKYKWQILLIILISYLFFTFIKNKDGRFTIHLLVFTSLITVTVLDFLYKKSRFVVAIAGGLFATFVIGYFLLLSLRPAKYEGLKVHANLPIFGGLDFINVDESLVKKYDSSAWRIDEVIKDLEGIKKQNSSKKEPRILVISEFAHFNPSNLRTYTKAAGVGDIQIVTPDLPYLRKNYQSDQFPDDVKLNSFINNVDYILASTSDIGSPYLLNMKAMRQIQNLLDPKATYCNELIFTSTAKTSCIVKAGEKLKTDSDIEIEGKVIKGYKELEGHAQIYCPWGCSFGLIETQNFNTSNPKLQFVKIYTLPNGVNLHLYQVLKQTNLTN